MHVRFASFFSFVFFFGLSHLFFLFLCLSYTHTHTHTRVLQGEAVAFCFPVSFLLGILHTDTDTQGGCLNLI